MQYCITYLPKCSCTLALCPGYNNEVQVRVQKFSSAEEAQKDFSDRGNVVLSVVSVRAIMESAMTLSDSDDQSAAGWCSFTAPAGYRKVASDVYTALFRSGYTTKTEE